MGSKKKITGLVVAAIGISVLAWAGKQVADKYAHQNDKRASGIVLPAAKDEYTRLVQQFMHPDTVSIVTGTIRLFDGEHPESLKEKSDFIFARKGRSYYSKMSFMEIACNGKWLVQVDSLNKVLMIAGIHDSLQAMPLPPDMGGMVNKWFADTASFKVTGQVTGDDKERAITVRSDFNPEIQYFTLHYSPADYTVKAAEIRFWKNKMPEPDSSGRNKVWISKIEYRTDGLPDLDINNRMSRIFSVKKGKVEPAAPYRDYQVMVK
ncbi:MAG TPA: hypothetical protein VLD19_13550 [Chitinophagaceae bacterium]|nr:hypothetical protein [Chitinophagaceae bacterium]